MLKQFRYTFPLILFVGVVFLLWRGLGLHPNQIPSPLIDKPAPSFQLPLLQSPDKTLTNNNLKGQITLLNVWASWCYACTSEHSILLEISNDPNIVLYGLNYKDDPENAKKWLDQYGNPFKMVAVDTTGNAAIDWGVYGTPETFLIDKKGIVRYKQIGPITADNWENTLKPLIEKIQSESP